MNKLNHQSLYIQSFTESALEVMDVHQRDVELWLLRSKGRILGYVLSMIDQHPLIDAFIIGKKYRGQGLGGKLIQSIRGARCKEAVKLLVLRADKRAIAFYQSQGGFFDYDHLSRFTHLVIFPPLQLDWRMYALSGESELDTESQTVD
ncbi:hypothetical protein MOC16_gp006 [Klebsiella phage vB_KpM_FBKp24]|uniref:N-acetyltransferase domain-containing protein n=1 Tax=Klebsiella phage vB_KpM_FBKp24 TaxID=2801834 RepID=A0A7U0GBK8_9CAUD|nr:hypothetical protein MOC16_gp006 [Klebsiella phage vB_KpM_FBKp24]QQV92208.1 hypothetical protein vBKpMFBKp24_006 [Klebsiella phage vB_KpM_FBKp24]